MSLGVGKRYKLEDQLGAGAFGEIYAGVDTRTNQSVAVKLEHSSADHPQLAYEARVYQQLNACRIAGIPQLMYSGREGKYNVLVLERLGDNLETLLTQCHRRMSTRTILLLADQLLRLIEKVHDQGFIHRDLKPENIVAGTGAHSNQVYLIDFGLSKCFWNPVTDTHIPFRNDKHLTGTARYASTNNHKGYEQSRRDDLESFGYVLLYLHQGRLPWQNQVGASRKEKYQKMLVMKEQAVRSGSLFQNVPPLFATYFTYVCNLNFDDRPDYAYLRTLFSTLYSQQFTPTEPKLFDWQSQHQSRAAPRSTPPQPPRRYDHPTLAGGQTERAASLYSSSTSTPSMSTTQASGISSRE
jgi:serine/threonine protein kinase